MTLVASEIMTSPVVSVRRDTGVHDIARFMAERNISAVPVLEEDGTLAGIITDGDLIRPFRESARQKRNWWLTRLAADEVLSQEFLDYARTDMRTAEDIMVRHVVSVDEKASIPEVAGLMVAHHVRCIPILRGGRVVGIISRPDLVSAIARAPAMLT